MRLQDPPQCWPPQRLFAMLKDSKAQERESWRNSLLTSVCNKVADIGPMERDQAVSWMAHLNAQFGFYPETFFLGTHCLDRFLTCIKSHRKYLRCIALTCLYLASKIMEEEEIIPGTAQLVENSDCGCRVQDILRMERIILTKLDWSIMAPTVFTYLQIFHSLAFTHRLKTPPSSANHAATPTMSTFFCRHFDLLADELQKAVCRYNVVVFSSSAIALALLSLEIENLTGYSGGWMVITSQLQGCAKLDTDELMSCREALITLLPRRLCNPRLNNPVYLVTSPAKSVSNDNTYSPQPAGLQGAVKRKANDPNLAVAGSDQVKKIHTLEAEGQSVLLDAILSPKHFCINDHGSNVCGVLPDLAIWTVDNGFGSQKALFRGSGHPVVTVKNSSEVDLPRQRHSPPQDLIPPRFTHIGHRLKTASAEPFVWNLLVDAGIQVNRDWCQTQTNSGENLGEYDSDQTFTTSEAEEEDESAEEKKYDTTRLRPLTYAEIVKCGIIESTATIVTVASVTEACF